MPSYSTSTYASCSTTTFTQIINTNSSINSSDSSTSSTSFFTISNATAGSTNSSSVNSSSSTTGTTGYKASSFNTTSSSTSFTPTTSASTSQSWVIRINKIIINLFISTKKHLRKISDEATVPQLLTVAFSS